MSLYLDASGLVAFVRGRSGGRSRRGLLSAHPAIIVVSYFGAAEFSSALARRVRMHDLTRDEGRLAFANFDDWIARSASRQNVIAVDIESADRILRSLDVNLRTTDAVHIAIARRLDATLVTFDRGMAAAGGGLGMAVVTP